MFKDLIMGMLIVWLLILTYVIWFNVDNMKVKTDDQYEMILQLNQEIIQLKSSNDVIFDKFTQEINNRTKRSDICLIVEDMVNKYLEVFDER